MNESDYSEELILCFDEDTSNLTKEALSVKGISFRVETMAPNSDLPTSGAGKTERVMIKVRASDLDSARAALAVGSSKEDLPEDHFLQDASDQDLVDIVMTPSEWSPFDVGHANRLILEGGIDVEKIQKEKKQKIAELKEGKPVPGYLLFIGWASCLVIGLPAAIIGFSIHSWRKKTDFGTFYVYNERGRKVGAVLAVVGTVLIAATISLNIFVKFTR